MKLKTWLAAACLLVAPSSAFAAVYDFTSTETSALGNPTYSFALDTATAMLGSMGSTVFSNVTIDNSGVSDPGQTVTLTSPETLASSLFFLLDTDVPGPKPFATGTGSSVAFIPGRYVIADGATDGEGILTISQASVSAAPEPSAWSLMIAGVGFAGLALRRARTVAERRLA